MIYVGKAKDIKKRVASYFSKNITIQKTTLLVKNIHSIDLFVTKNEVEALILKNNLIKKHYLKFNINLKGSHRYMHLKLRDDKSLIKELKGEMSEASKKENF
jgi:excinuclease ABC subunit C